MDLQELIKYAESYENSKIRASIWGDFFGWDTRRRGENGFLINQLKKTGAKKNLDVALGDGVDTIYLLQNGFDASSNELDNAFREKAIENARKAGFRIQPTNLEWRELSKTYQDSSFDAVICLGNSLTCVFGGENQVKCLKQFRSVLKPEGVLLIDERNYQKILENREKVLSGDTHLLGNLVDPGTAKVKSEIVYLEPNLILVGYKSMEGTEAYYKGYPFKKGELLNLIKEAGFQKESSSATMNREMIPMPVSTSMSALSDVASALCLAADRLQSYATAHYCTVVNFYFNFPRYNFGLLQLIMVDRQKR